MQVSGRDVLSCSLEGLGVRFVTGRSEGALGPVFDHLGRLEGVTAITPRGDIAGAFMAYSNTYYNFFPALVLASTPADAANAISGFGTAWADKIPVMRVTVKPESRAPGGLPGQTHARIFSAFSKSSVEVARAGDIPKVVGQALREAMSGCHRPVHIDVPERVLEETVELSDEELAGLIAAGVNQEASPTIQGDSALVEKGLKALLAAERPLILAGGGVVHAQAWDEMDALVRALEVPASTSIAGEGTVLGDNPFYIGGPTYVGGEAFHRAIKRADRALIVGAALGGLEGFGQPPLWNADIRLVQVDVDPVNICLNAPVEIPILGDAKAVIGQMLELVRSGAVEPNRRHRAWLEHLLAVKGRWRKRIEDEANASWPIIHQGYLARVIGEAAEPGTFFVIDGGNTTLWAGMFSMPHRPKSALFPAGMGTLGSGIPMAVGLKAAAPERPLVLIQGDGSFLYNIQELATARRLGMSFVVVIFNDGCWNMIKGAQDMFLGGRRFGAFLPGSDYAAIARGFGCYGRRVEKAAEIKPAFEEARSSGLPAVLDVIVDPDTFPEPLASFAVGEFWGVRFSPLRMVGVPKIKLDRRLLNRAKYAANILLDRDIR
jgi:thiamine pyrophosphate-dependent acetolactate synthase large subunit-like protein